MLMNCIHQYSTDWNNKNRSRPLDSARRLAQQQLLANYQATPLVAGPISSHMCQSSPGCPSKVANPMAQPTVDKSKTRSNATYPPPESPPQWKAVVTTRSSTTPPTRTDHVAIDVTVDDPRDIDLLLRVHYCTPLSKSPLASISQQ